jgi:hypothetical protein
MEISFSEQLSRIINMGRANILCQMDKYYKEILGMVN